MWFASETRTKELYLCRNRLPNSLIRSIHRKQDVEDIQQQSIRNNARASGSTGTGRGDTDRRNSSGGSVFLVDIPGGSPQFANIAHASPSHALVSGWVAGLVGSDGAQTMNRRKLMWPKRKTAVEKEVKEIPAEMHKDMYELVQKSRNYIPKPEIISNLITAMYYIDAAESKRIIETKYPGLLWGEWYFVISIRPILTVFV